MWFASFFLFFFFFSIYIKHTEPWTEVQTASNTEITSVLLVKWLIPISPFSCCRPIMIAAPPINPTMAACERKSTRKPSLPNVTNKIRNWVDTKPEGKRTPFDQMRDSENAPEQSKCQLEDTREKCCSENQFSVGQGIQWWIDHFLNHGR